MAAKKSPTLKKQSISIRIDLDYVAAEKLDKFRTTNAGSVSRRAAATKMVYDALGLNK